jgi:hypothetical protein
METGQKNRWQPNMIAQAVDS